MKKYCLYLLLLTLSCSKKGDKETATQAILVGPYWQTYEYYLNDVLDPEMSARIPVFEFRTDGMVYKRLINPLKRDTFHYKFLNEQNIELSKPGTPVGPVNLKIDSLEGSHFNFTITDGSTGSSEFYKTVKL